METNSPSNQPANMASAMDLTNDSVQTPTSEVKKSCRGRPKGSKNREPDPNSKNAILATKFLENVVVPENYIPPKTAKKRTSEGPKVSKMDKLNAASEGGKSESALNTSKVSKKDKAAVTTGGERPTSTSNTPEVPRKEQPAAAAVGEQNTSTSNTPKVSITDKPVAAIDRQRSTSTSNTPKKRGRPPLGEGKSRSVSNTPKVLKKEKPTAGGQSASGSNTSKRGRGRPRKYGSISTPLETTKRTPATQSTESTRKNSEESDNPDVAFKRFKRLPKEVQSLIWEFALAEAPSIVEATYNPSICQFEISGPTAGIISVCGSANIPKYFKPIYLPAKEQESTVAPVFIRPEQDILYIPSLGKLDNSFVFFTENQVLQHLGFAQQELSAEYLFYGNKPDSLSVAKGLKLKTLYVLEGKVKGEEDKVDRNKKYEIVFVDMQQGRESGPALPLHPRWMSEEFEAVKESFVGNLRRVKNKEIHIPEVIGKEVKRTVIS